jgi:Phage Mu protein F like protein
VTPEELSRITIQVRDDLEAAVEPLANEYRRIIRRAGRVMARTVRARTHLTAGLLPPDEDEVVPDLDEQTRRTADRERARMVQFLADAYTAQEIAFDIHGVFTPELLEKVGAHASFAIDQELRAIYRDVIEQAATQGLSIPNTASEIVAAVDGTSGARATALARTDLIGLANGASQAVATDTFVGRDDVLKVWLATEDDRTRDTHVDANGQEQQLNEYFDVGGYPLMYPGDPDGPDEEVINCRCTQIYSGSPAGNEQAEEEEGEAFTVRPAPYAALSMPWHKVQNHADCPSDRPWAVVKDDDGEVEGCHATEADANAQLAALNAQEEDMSTSAVELAPDDERERTPWEGVLAIAGSPSSDGRFLIPGEIEHRDLPLPFRVVLEQQAGGHDGAIQAGRIEEIEFVPAGEFTAFDVGELPERAVIIFGRGTLDGSAAADEAQRVIENGAQISIDMPTTRTAAIDPETLEEVDLSTLNPLDAILGMESGDYLLGFAGKIAAATIVDVSAFEETKVRLIDDHDVIVASAFHGRVGLVSKLPELPLVASVAPLEPPRDWFFQPEAEEPTPLTVTKDGRVYGHVALWNTCHAGRSNGAFSTCMYAPFSPSNYKQFHLGAILCDDGAEVAIGKITVDTGHAAMHLGAAAARRHYDNTGSVAAFVRAADGLFGIWVSGVIRSDATDEQVRDLRAAAPSGDWRSVDHALELQAILAVNTPGYPVPRSQLALAASADPETLEIATLILAAPDADDYTEAMLAEVEGVQRDDVDMLVELTYLGNQV